jgi:hypothetical protein
MARTSAATFVVEGAGVEDVTGLEDVTNLEGVTGLEDVTDLEGALGCWTVGWETVGQPIGSLRATPGVSMMPPVCATLCQLSWPMLTEAPELVTGAAPVWMVTVGQVLTACALPGV